MSWNTARTKAGLAWFRVHDSRHHYASRMIIDGNSDILAVSTLLGHSSVRQSQRYAYLTQSHLAE
jgi:integrase